MAAFGAEERNYDKYLQKKNVLRVYCVLGLCEGPDT